MIPSRGRQARGRAGISVVEFAVVVPIFFLFVLGIVEIARGMMTIHVLNNAARVGCREGILTGKTTSDIQSTVKSTLSAQGINGITTTVQVNGKDVDASTAVTTDELSVTVTVPVANITWVPVPRFLSGNIAGRFTLRRE